jgi:pantoate--beta-alanine ligase
MIVFSDEVLVNQHLNSMQAHLKSVGFVPTMGALHFGHLSLIKKSSDENEITVVSIFVNPIQFNNPEDLQKYPRTLKSDLEKIESVCSNAIVFTPNENEIFLGKKLNQKFRFGGIENQMEGKFRPGHFNGVATIVKILFDIIKPNNAYFGKKDFQQLCVVKKLVQILNLPINIIGCDIAREINGLAMSSRNERLSASAREKSSLLYKILQDSKNKFQTKTISKLKEEVIEIFKSHPEFHLEYFEICNEINLKPSKIKTKDIKYRTFIAVHIENIRLIDNISLN